MIDTNHKKQSSFAAGAVLLAVSAIVVKVIGVCYKIPLVHLLGAEGMGYFNAAYDVYALLCVISTTGLPVAVSVVMNRRPGNQKRIYLLSLAVFTILGMLGAAGVFFCADRIAIWVGAPAAAQSLRFIAPAVLFVCLCGAYRGYYQAKRNMLPTAISQVVEAAGKLIFGLLFAYLCILGGKRAPVSAAFAALGLSVGTLLCLIYLAIFNKREWRNDNAQDINTGKLLRELLVVAFPVTLSAVLTGLSKVIDLSLIMRRLQDAGVLQTTAVAMYGCYSSMVIPLFNVIPALFGSLAMSLVPHLSHAIGKRDQKAQAHIISTAFRWGIALSVPASLGMGMLSPQILQLLFSCAEETQAAIPMLVIICMAVPASCLISATSAVLQAYGRAWLPMISASVGCIIKAVVLYVLCGMPQIGILAAPISTCLCCMVIAGLNLILLDRFVPEYDFCGTLVRTLGASALAVGTAAVMHRLLFAHLHSLVLCVGFTVLTAILIYFPIAFKCALIRISDIKSITSNKEKEC